MDSESAYPIPTTPPRRFPALPPAGSPQRNPEDLCFRCKRKGHWMKECPEKIAKHSHPSSPESASSSSSTTSLKMIPLIRCPCGKGTCPVRTSSSARNPGKKYYACPCDRQSQCNFFRWVDEVVDLEIPQCRCGAGACSVSGEPSDPYASRWYFSCRIKKNHGACKFFQWADSEVNNVMNGRGKGNYSPQPLSTSCPVLSVPSPEKDELLVRKLVMTEPGTSDPPILSEVCRVSSIIPQQEIHHRKSDCWSKIYAAEDILTLGVIYQILGHHFYGWLGRLVFPPSPCMKERPAGPFYCCVFPSFNSIPVPDNENVSGADQGLHIVSHSHSIDENTIKLPQTPRQDARMSSGTLRPRSRLRKFHKCDGLFRSTLKKHCQDMLDKLAEIEDLSTQELTDIYNGEKARFEENMRRHEEILAAYNASDSLVQSLHNEVTCLKNKLLFAEKELTRRKAETLELENRVNESSTEMLESEMCMEAAFEEMRAAEAHGKQREAAVQAIKAVLEIARAELQQ